MTPIRLGEPTQQAKVSCVVYNEQARALRAAIDMLVEMIDRPESDVVSLLKEGRL